MLTLTAAATGGKKTGQGQGASSAAWLSGVSKPVKGVMSAMQQMASAAVQANEERDSSHARLVHSMTPDALLACGTSPHTAAACLSFVPASCRLHDSVVSA